MTTAYELDRLSGLLILPRVRVQSLNAISSPLTWGFPSITAFMGFMWALERKVSAIYSGIAFRSVGVICHSFQPLVTDGGFTTSFNLTRNPLTKTGETRPISEEGRAHASITIVFSVGGSRIWREESDESRVQIAASIEKIVRSMRIAGGSVFLSEKNWEKPCFMELDSDMELADKQFKKIRRTWLPGSALVLRQDLLDKYEPELAGENRIDSWMDFARIKSQAVKLRKGEEVDGDNFDNVEWRRVKQEGWLVPIPVGYGAVSSLYPAGTVENGRDSSTPFRFVESIYSVGQWISPHKLSCLRDMLWYPESDPESGIYKCANFFAESIM